MTRPVKPSVFIFTVDVLIENSQDRVSAWVPRKTGFWLLNGIASKGESFVLVHEGDTPRLDLPLRKAAETVLTRAAIAPTSIRIVPLAHGDPSAVRSAWLKSLPQGERKRIRIAFDIQGDTASDVWAEFGIDTCGISPGRRN